jgi:hypothetical protein
MPVKSIAQLPPPPPPPVLQQTPKKEVADGPQQQQHKVAKPMIQVPPSTGTLKRTPKTEPEEDQVPMKKFVVAATNSRGFLCKMILVDNFAKFYSGNSRQKLDGCHSYSLVFR